MSSCVCIPYIKSVPPRVCLVKIPFLAFFLPKVKTVLGVVVFIYLKHSTDYIDSKYIWVHGSNSLGVFVAKMPFLAFLALHKKRKG